MAPDKEVHSSPEPTTSIQARNERVFYPLLFGIFPVLSIYSANLALVPWQMMIRPLAVVLASTGLLWILFSLLLRNGKRAAVATTTLVGCTLLYSRFTAFLQSQDVSHEAWMNTWIVTTLILTVVMTWKWRRHKILNILSVSLVLAAFGQIIYGLIMASIHVSGRQSSDIGSSGTSKDRPDIIYVILDGYGRSDALKRALGYSNDWFIRGLQDRGFYVAEDAHANYCQTELSVSSSLNMDFIQNLLPKMKDSDNDRAPLENLLDKNAVAAYLRKKGYAFAAITTGFPPLQFDSADINMKTRAGLSLIETALIQMTPLASDKFALQRMFTERRANVMNAFDELESLGSRGAVPRFVMVHILAPHPPFVFGSDGQALPPQMPFGFWDGSDYMDYVGRPEDYRHGYTGQADYVGRRVLKAIDSIFATSGKRPVILIQGDHGSKLRLDQAELNHTDINECFPNLSAYYVPDSVRQKLYPGITPVNSFRLLFDGLFDDHLATLPDRSWYSSFPLPYKFFEVTAQIADHTKMASVPIPNFPPRPAPKGK